MTPVGRAAKVVADETDEPMWSAVVIARSALTAALDVDELAAVIDRADDDWQHGIGASGTTWDRAIAHAVRDYLTGDESDE